jgi:hypothetical protein
MITSITKVEKKKHNSPNLGWAVKSLMYESDPFLNLLRSILRITPMIAYLLFSIVGFTLESAFCYFKGCLFSTSDFVGIWNEPLNFSNFILFYPVLFSLYIWLPGGIEAVFISMQNNEIVPSTKRNMNSLVRFNNYMNRLLSVKIWFYLIAVIALAVDLLLILPGTTSYKVWWNNYILTFCFITRLPP